MTDSRQSIALLRDCPGTAIPAGTPVLMKKGEQVAIAQSLGGTYTLWTPAGMVRIEGKDADAIGKQVEEASKPAEVVRGPVEREKIWDQMKTCYDPEIPVNIVDLGLVYDCEIKPLPDGGNRVDIKMTLTAPGCGMGETIRRDVESRVKTVPGVTEANVELVWDPPWNQGMMSEAAKLQLGLM
jgi:probable FeS assembly SUF system protein SufT